MKKLFKIFGVIILIILLLIVIIPVAFKGKIREAILNEANKSLNARLEVGKVSVSLFKSFPNVYVGINDILITGINDFEEDTLVRIGELSVSAGLFDLIGGSPYEIRKINIDDADARLKVLADGKANWDIVKPSAEEQPGSDGTGSFRLLLKSLVISDSRLVYDDATLDTYVELEGLYHTLRGDLGEDRSILETQTGVMKAYVDYEGITYLRDAVIDWNADIDADFTKSIYTFKDNLLSINDFPVVFNGSVGLQETGYDLDLTFSTPESTFKKLLSLVPDVYSKDFASVRTDGTVAFDGFVKGFYTDERYPAFGINLKVDNAWFQYPDLPSAVNDINISAHAESSGGELDNTVIDVNSLSMNLAGNPVKARLFLKNPMTDPYIDTRIEASINLADVGKFYPLEEGDQLAGQIISDITLKGRLSSLESGRYNEFEATGMFQSSGIDYQTSYLAQTLEIGSLKLTVTPANLDLSDLRIKSGMSDFNLKGKLENYLAYYLKGEELRGNFTLNSALIDANELLTFTDPGQPAATDTSALSAFLVPKDIDFNLGVDISSLKYMNYDLRNVTGRIRVKDQKLNLDGLTMNAMGGTLSMKGSYASADPANPVVDFNLGLKNIDIRQTAMQIPMVSRFAPVLEKVIGDFSGEVSLAGLLDGNMMPRLESMAGAGTLITSAIEMTNVNTLNQLSTSLKMEQLKNIKANGAKIIVEFLKGVMEVKPFDFKALGIDMNLGGQTALNQQIGYILKMKIPRSMMGGEANGVMNDLVAKASQSGADIKLGDYVNLDALIEGTITDPKVKLNLAGTGNDILESVKEQVKQQVEQKVEEIKDDAKEEAEKILQEADQKAQAILDQAKKQSDEVLKNAQKLADEAKKQANSNADKLVSEAKGKGLIAEAAAKKSAEEVRKQGDKQAENIMSEARKQSDSILNKAKEEADKVKAEARQKIK